MQFFALECGDGFGGLSDEPAHGRALGVQSLDQDGALESVRQAVGEGAHDVPVDGVDVSATEEHVGVQCRDHVSAHQDRGQLRSWELIRRLAEQPGVHHEALRNCPELTGEPSGLGELTTYTELIKAMQEGAGRPQRATGQSE